MQKELRAKILIIDDEPDIRELIRMMVESVMDAEILEAKNGEEAIQLLNQHTGLDGIFCDFRMPKANGDKVYKAFKKKNLTCPFVLVSGEMPETYPEFASVKDIRFVQKPNIAESVVRELEHIQENRKKRGVVDVSSEERFCAVTPAFLLLVGDVPFDLYVGIGNQKKVKILQKGEKFFQEDFEKMEKKSIDRLYVLSEDFLVSVQNLQRRVVLVSSARNVLAKDCFSLSTTIVEFIRELNQTLCCPEEVHKLIQSTVEMVVKSISSDVRLAELLGEISVKPGTYYANHVVVLVYCLAVFSSKVGLVSHDSLRSLVEAALLHDIGIDPKWSERILVMEERALEPSQQDFEEVRAFRNHPEKAADLMARSSVVSGEAVEIVTTHHLMPDGRGYPEKKNFEPSKVQVLFYLAEAYVAQCFKSKTFKPMPVREFLNTNAPLYGTGVWKSTHRALTLAYANS